VPLRLGLEGVAALEELRFGAAWALALEAVFTGGFVFGLGIVFVVLARGRGRWVGIDRR
jgi:hypothetical protein